MGRDKVGIAKTDTGDSEKMDTGDRLEGNVMITGGCGTLGSAILRRAYAENWPAQFTVYSRDPLKHQRTKRQYPNARYVLGDIRDYDAIYRTAVGMDTILHLAAQKHIPEAEANVLDTIETNITGSINVGTAAIQAGVKRVLGTSTDKVAHSINIYGHTKALMEGAFRELNQLGLTTFHLCRYGNVIGSNGSVLQVWQRQLADGKRPTITHPQMTRFWLTENQAVDLVLLALSEQPGAITIPLAPALDMGKFAAYLLGEDVGIEIIGLRPGEKFNEELITEEEAQRAYNRHKQLDNMPYVVLVGEGETVEGAEIANITSLKSGYRSNYPDRWLTRSEIRGMVGL